MRQCKHLREVWGSVSNTNTRHAKCVHNSVFVTIWGSSFVYWASGEQMHRNHNRVSVFVATHSPPLRWAQGGGFSGAFPPSWGGWRRLGNKYANFQMNNQLNIWWDKNWKHETQSISPLTTPYKYRPACYLNNLPFLKFHLYRMK